MRMVVRRHALRLRQPLQSSYGAVAERELLAVSLTDEDGVTGYGEAAPLEPYDGVSIARVEEALERYRPVVEGAEGMNGAEIVSLLLLSVSLMKVVGSTRTAILA